MTKERFGSVFLFVVAVYALVQSSRLPMGEWNQPGPGVFPLALSILLSIISISLFFSSTDAAKLNWKDSLSRQKKAWSIVGLTAGFILCFDWLGFVLTAGLYLFILFFRISRLSFVYATALAVGLTGAGWYFFVKILTLKLPTGLWRLL